MADSQLHVAFGVAAHYFAPEIVRGRFIFSRSGEEVVANYDLSRWKPGYPMARCIDPGIARQRFLSFAGTRAMEPAIPGTACSRQSGEEQN